MDAEARREILGLEPHPLKAQLRRLGVSQNEASNYLGISQAALNLFLNGFTEGQRPGFEAGLSMLVKKVAGFKTGKKARRRLRGELS